MNTDTNHENGEVATHRKRESMEGWRESKATMEKKSGNEESFSYCL